jgi:hypothetical protein
MRSEFRSYNTAYADALNHQMLLNLARLENGHPAYYLAIGSITNRFIDTAAATAGTTGQGTSTHNSHPYDVMGTATGFAQFPGRLFQTIFGYSGGAAYTHTKNPDFQFIPINNEVVARQILDPVLPDVFFTLYNQGYPIDQLMRVMIERVETSLPNTNEEVTFINSPAHHSSALIEARTPSEIREARISDPAQSYARFLRGCAILREMQIKGYLVLEANKDKQDLGPVSFDTPDRRDRPNPTAKEFAEAEKAGYHLKQEDREWRMQHDRSSSVFVLKNKDDDAYANKVIQQLENDANLVPRDEDAKDIKDTYDAILNVVGLLQKGIALQTKAGERKPATAHLVLRSFDRSMKAVATEQPAFEEFAQTEKPALEIVPEAERRPILQMMWPEKNRSFAPPLQTVHYGGKTYEITDPVINPLEAGANWNRDVFRLLVALNSQVTVDISKFQQQTLQLLPSP